MSRVRELALRMVGDMRTAPAAATRVAASIDRCDLEQVVLELAAMVPDDVPMSTLRRRWAA